ncbi:MAG: glycosyltransferase family 39 protein [Chloroflexota bacterium]
MSARSEALAVSGGRLAHAAWLSASMALAVGVLSFVLRIRDAGSRSLWMDELFTVAFVAQSPRTMLDVLYGEEANMALYYAVMVVWSWLVGHGASELFVRLPSIVFGAASATCLYLLGLRLASPAAGAAAALLAAVNAYQIVMSQEARSYALWGLLATLSWLLLDRAVAGRRDRDAALYGGAVAAAFYAHFFTAFIVAAQVVFVLLVAGLRGLRSLTVAGACAALLALPALPFFLAHHDGAQIAHVRSSDLADLLSLVRLFSGGSWPTLALMSAALVALIAAAARSAPTSEATRRWLLPVCWLVIPILLVFLLSYVKPMFKERYLFPSALAVSLIVGLAIGLIRPLWGRLAALIAAVALTWFWVPPDLAARQDENWRGAIAYVQANAQPDDGYVFISKRGQLGYEYYAGRLAIPAAQRPRFDLLEPYSWDELASGAYRESNTTYRALAGGTSGLADFAASHSRVWLVLSHEFDAVFDGDTSASVRDWLTRRGYAARQRTFQGIRVLLYERRS